MKNPDQGRKAPGRAQVGLSAFTEIVGRRAAISRTGIMTVVAAPAARVLVLDHDRRMGLAPTSLPT